jgi:propanediol dehydratase small subunit
MNPLIALSGIVALSAAVMFLVERWRFRHFWARTCTGPAWKAAFPAASKGEIRAFLELFVRAFGFRSSRKVSFEPSDRVLDIYRTRYPSNFSPDSLELESLLAAAKKRYGRVPVWHENITLGELFEQTRRRVA